ncbi:M23 family metallopeptidase [Sphingobacterium hungaricum]|uniref:M23 family peptidase n=1 Tax=Sphingobacterium hungaricum TaxID=2082723 RepID=A0A928YRB4_9SPHI|nr:M23 family metallopeptidase [Sphingobacterium hungaricum]MBE8713955.1 M23 family peptidase [Sphingobacterium hungaricum]
MFKKKTSVLILDSDGASSKNIQIPTVLFLHWKKILLSVLATIIILIFSISYFVKQKTSEEYTAVYTKKLIALQEQNKQLSLEELNSKQTDGEVKKSFNAIDSTLDRINEKMKKRGLKTISLKNMGGPVEEDEEDIVELTNYYKSSLKNLEKKLDGMPIGVPHKGKITSRYGYRRNPFTNRGREMHSGVDLKGRTGDPVKVTAKGVVDFAGYKGQYGKLVVVKHANGFETRYAHLSKVKVKKGQRIDVGDLVGLLGNTGRSTGPHLHYEILHNNKKVNPSNFFTF